MKAFLSASQLFETNERIKEMAPIKQKLNHTGKIMKFNYMFKGEVYLRFGGTSICNDDSFSFYCVYFNSFELH